MQEQKERKKDGQEHHLTKVSVWHLHTWNKVRERSIFAGKSYKIVIIWTRFDRLYFFTKMVITMKRREEKNLFTLSQTNYRTECWGQYYQLK